MVEQKRCSYLPCGSVFQPKRSTAEYCSTVCRVYANRDRQPASPRKPNYEALYQELTEKFNDLVNENWLLKTQLEDLQTDLTEANRRKAGYLEEPKPGSIYLEPGDPRVVGQVV